MDAFQRAFELVIGHEGGYVNDPANGLEYVNGSSHESHSRIRSGHVRGAECGGTDAYAVGSGDLYPACELAQVRMRCAWLRPSSVCEGAVQRSLHPSPQWVAYGRSGASTQAGGRVRAVRRRDWSERRLGTLPAPLPTGAVRDTEGCGHWGVRLKVRALRRFFPSLGVRFPSPWGQAWFSQRDVPQQITQRASQRASQVHPAVRQLPPAGAPR